MKIITPLILLFIFVSCKTNQVSEEEKTVPMEEENLSEKWGADEYGMKEYVMAFLKKGPNRDQDSTEAAAIQKAHLENINKMVADGKLVLAGPFLDDFDVQGIYIFDVATIEEAEELTATDPAVKAGRLIMELHPWYGSAAVTGVTELHYKMDPSSVIEE